MENRNKGLIGQVQVLVFSSAWYLTRPSWITGLCFASFPAAVSRPASGHLMDWVCWVWGPKYAVSYQFEFQARLAIARAVVSCPQPPAVEATVNSAMKSSYTPICICITSVPLALKDLSNRITYCSCF